MKENKFLEQSIFETILDEATSRVINDVEEEVDIITFCEHPLYLDQPLHGVERFILKIFYGLPLDDTNKNLNIRSYPYNRKGKKLTEFEYAQFLISQGRTNLLDPRNCKEALELVLACGRRGGKTFLASVISSYEAYKLIIKGDPQKYYKLPQGEIIKIINIASSSDQALVLAQATQNRILNSKWFIPYVEGKNQSDIRLRTKRDLELLKQEIAIHGKPLDMHASIRIEAMACTARGVRGGTVIVGILDEIAHYIDNDGNRSGGVIYEALTPSVATFGLDGKILCISSPYTKHGIFYDLFLDSKGRTEEDEGDQNKRMFQIPTWEMNETITFEYLDSEKKRNPESFTTEFGAEFSSIISGFLKFPEKLDICIRRDGETTSPTGNHIHYIAVDPASSNHGYALAMVHIEEQERIKKEENREIKSKEQIVVLDRWKVWTIKDPEFEGMDMIDPTVVEEYIQGLANKFRISIIAYDQFESTSSISKFKKLGFNAIKTPFSRPYNMKIYGKLRSLIYEDKIDLFKFEQGILELKNLQERKVGKRQFIIEAPTQGEITTDDLCDVLANASFIASDTEMDKRAPSIVGTNGNQSFHTTGSRVKSFHAYQRRLKMHRVVTNMERAKQLGIVR